MCGPRARLDRTAFVATSLFQLVVCGSTGGMNLRVRSSRVPHVHAHVHVHAHAHAHAHVHVHVCVCIVSERRDEVMWCAVHYCASGHAFGYEKRISSGPQIRGVFTQNTLIGGPTLPLKSVDTSAL